MDKTLQNALIALYGSLGGDRETLSNPENIGALLCDIAKLNLGASISGASVKELPPFPEDDDFGKSFNEKGFGEKGFDRGFGDDFPLDEYKEDKEKLIKLRERMQN